MRNTVALFFLLILALVRPLAASIVPARPAPVVPAAFDALGLHLVLNEEARRLVQLKADGLTRHQPSFQARVDLADAAFPIIDRVLREEGVPLDFRYLALQESALLGDAESVHQAVGYWQLKREAASDLGLIVNSEVDQRKHLVASTRAAARYLSRNNAGLRNWLTALLSYNTGLTGVKPYTLPTDAGATQMAITEATSPYVLAFLAHKVAFEPYCGLNPKPPLRLQEFPAAPGQTLEAQALALHTDAASLAVHNRWLLAAAVPADRPYTLLVPIGDVTQAAGIIANQRLQSAKELLTVPEVSTTTTAEVRLNTLRAIIALPGETTADLARRGNQRLRDFLRHNELTAFDAAVTGRPYYLESKRDKGAVEYHVAQPGESIFDVAQKYGMRKKAVLAKNRMYRNEELRAGRLLWLQLVRPREVAVEFRTLPESVGIERAVASSRPANAEAGGQASEPVSRGNEKSPAKNRRTDSEDGWGETVPSRNAPVVAAQAPPTVVPTPPAPVAVPAPIPVRPAPATEMASQLPPPASAPAPTPLADEPRETEARAVPAAEPAVPKPVVATSAPEPAKPAGPIVPRPVAAAPAPVPAATPVPATPAVAAPAVSAASLPATHQVAPRESVYSIARLYQMPPATLMALNNLTPPANLLIGQVLQLKAKAGQPAALGAVAPVRVATPAGQSNPAVYSPKPAVAPVATSPTPAAGETIQHTVVKGETLFSISRLYKVKAADLQALNGKLDGNVRIGEVLKVQPSTK